MPIAEPGQLAGLDGRLQRDSSARGRTAASRRSARLRARCRPFSVSGRSDVPVWRPFRLHSVSPCRASSSSPIAQQANRQNDAPMFERERTDVAEACRRLAAEGLVIGTAGNVSARAGESEVAISPTGATLGALEPEQVTSSTCRAKSSPATCSRPRSSISTSASTVAMAPAQSFTRTRRWRPRSRASSTSCPASTTRCFCSAGPFRWRPTRPSERRSWPSSVLDALDGRSARP